MYFKGDNWHVWTWQKPKCVFSDAIILSEIFETVQDGNLYWALHIHNSFGGSDPFSLELLVYT